MEIIGSIIKSRITGVEGKITKVDKGILKATFIGGISIDIRLEDIETDDEELMDAIYCKYHGINPGKENIAIKCTYCDGGENDKCIGFCGHCSDAIRKYNIAQGRTECSDPENLCNKYEKGKISREELDEGNPCYESRMLIDWKAYAGQHKSIGKKGETMSFKKVAPKSLCFLTTVLPDQDSEERFIFALFYVNETNTGDMYKEGYVKADPNYRFTFTREEALQLKFWDFYKNANTEKKIWSSLLHRYLDDEQAKNMLVKAIKVKKDPSEKAKMKELLEIFCKEKKLAVPAV